MKKIKEMNRYIEKMKFLKQFEKMVRASMLWLTESTLVYASWTNDKKLAAKEINHTQRNR